MQVNKLIAAASLTVFCASIPLASLADRRDEFRNNGKEVVRNAEIKAEVNHMEKEKSHDAALRDIEIKHAEASNRNLDKKIIHDQELRAIEARHNEGAIDSRINHDAAIRNLEIKHAEGANRGAVINHIEHHDDHHDEHHDDHHGDHH